MASLTLSEEHRLWVSRNKSAENTGYKKGKVTREWREMHE